SYLCGPLFSTKPTTRSGSKNMPPDCLQQIHTPHISLTAYTSYVTMFGFLSVLLFVGLSVLIFWRTFDQVAGLFASFCFLLLGLQTLAGDLSSMPSAIQIFVIVIQQLLLLFCLGFFLVTFPDGRFAPGWNWLIGARSLCRESCS
ncbi:MAG: hypothetical protein ACXWPG_18005, partial [Ktedonobacteraceae bacterium]